MFFPSSPQAGPPRHWYLHSCHVHPELLRQRYVFSLASRLSAFSELFH
jgi:hypothetical protein